MSMILHYKTTYRSLWLPAVITVYGNV